MVNRTVARAVELAERVGGRARPFSALAEAALADVDVLLTSTGSGSVVIEADVVGGPPPAGRCSSSTWPCRATSTPPWPCFPA